jgi:hypothetical protein
MSNGSTSGNSGELNLYSTNYETRRIIVAEGIDAREGDFRAKGDEPLFDFLSRNLGSEFQITGRTHAEFRNDNQKVNFIIDIVQSKQAFKDSLTSEDKHVVYMGHARYGRGACFDPNAPTDNHTYGNYWEQGDSNLNGIYRIGYPYVPVTTEDMEHHHYRFIPLKVEEGAPAIGERHPDARRRLSQITLTDDLQQYVEPGFESLSNKYWGYRSRNEINILLKAGWENTRSAPFDLGSTFLNCKVFCHFGCSSRIHFWHIVRHNDYKNWKRDNPPTNRFAYFTTATADYRVTFYWLYSILNYNQENNHQSWWNSLEHSKREVNRFLRTDRARYQVY